MAGFFVLPGDANRDGRVDVSDLGILASNWQQAGRRFSQGDFSYDGVVDVADLGILATHWAPAVPIAPTFASLLFRRPRAKAWRFADRPIRFDDLGAARVGGA